MPLESMAEAESVIQELIRVQFEVFLDEHRAALNSCLDGPTEEQASGKAS